MTLNDVWFFLFILIIAGYLILDGFDMGVGILLLPMARTDTERRILLNSIGPVWDGNEVWLVLGAGVLFAVFPLAYASLFSGLYLAFVLVLLVMILRTVALEFRSKESGRRWRSAWDTVFAVASTGLAFLLGLAFGNIIDGLPLDAQGNISTGLIGLLTPFTVLVGATTVAMFAMQGGIYLLIKTEGELHDRLQRAVPRLMIVFFVLNTVVVVALAVFHPTISERYLDDIWPALLPAAALVALGAAWVFVRRGEPFRAFLASSATIGLLLISGGVGLYPNLIISTTDTAYNLTIFNAASADNTLVDHPDLRAHRVAVRAALHDRRLLHLPGQDGRRFARLLGSAAVSRMRRTRDRTASPGDRLLRSAPGARGLLGLGIASGFVAAAIVVGQAWLTSVVVAGVFLGGGSLATVATPLVAIAVLAVVRAGFLLAADGLAQGASARIKSTLRADLTAQLFALGPAWTGSRAERRAEQRR